MQPCLAIISFCILSGWCPGDLHMQCISWLGDFIAGWRPEPDFTLTQLIIIIMRNTYIAPNPTRLAQSTSQFKARMNIRINTWNMHTQTIQRQQQSAGKNAHILEQSVQPRHTIQQYMDHGHISWLQIKCKEHYNNHIHNHIHKNWGSFGRFGRTSGFSTVT